MPDARPELPAAVPSQAKASGDHSKGAVPPVKYKPLPVTKTNRLDGIP
jgi:hypothetical protein